MKVSEMEKEQNGKLSKKELRWNGLYQLEREVPEAECYLGTKNCGTCRFHHVDTAAYGWFAWCSYIRKG